MSRVGEYDEYIALIERYGWTEQEIDEMTVGLYTELVGYINAEAVIKHKHKTKPKRTPNG